MIELLIVKDLPIFKQLQLEEALLRTDDRNWCIINVGSPPAIVMGVSGKPDELIYMDKATIPVIKRFSGGGTVVVDHNTLFVSFIFQKEALPIKAYPEPILEWSTDFYRDAFALEGFGKNENDYVINEKKCGGNAQYLSKNCWVHHTTFLWDFADTNMDLLKMPERQPKYREKREHKDFLVKLSAFFPSMEELVDRITKTLEDKFEVERASEKVFSLKFPEHRKSTTVIKKSVGGP